VAFILTSVVDLEEEVVVVSEVEEMSVVFDVVAGVGCVSGISEAAGRLG
jgi:hypothetical protein